MTVVAEQTFAPPGPGSWFLDPTHWTRPVTRFQAELFPDAFERGFGESLRRYGSLLEYLEAGFVNGFPYFYSVVPVSIVPGDTPATDITLSGNPSATNAQPSPG